MRFHLSSLDIIIRIISVRISVGGCVFPFQKFAQFEVPLALLPALGDLEKPMLAVLKPPEPSSCIFGGLSCYSLRSDHEMPIQKL
jgi:hypothetical protein